MTAGAPATTGRPRRRPAARHAVPLVAGAAALVIAALGIAGTDGGGPRARAAAVPTGLATAERRTLIDREDVDGTLSFASKRTVGAAASGTLTRVDDEGSTARRGESLYAVDAVSTGFVMYGDLPAWRALSLGAADGDDVRQLERNLAALGHDPADAMTIDEDFDAATAAAVRRWEDARGVTEDGVVERGEVVFTDGPVRVGAHKTARGEQVAAGRPVVEVSSRRRVVTARLPAGRQGLVERGDRVTVTLPDGATVRGEVTEVGRVAQTAQEGEEATVKLEVAVPGDEVRLDGAPVTVSVAATQAERALAVPVSALLATGAGEYAVEVRETGRTRRVPVEIGAFADGHVAIEGDVREGSRVVVPR